VEDRELIALSGATMAWPLIVSAQQAAKIPRIGYLAASLRIDRHLQEAFLERLRELGYVDGRNVLIEYRDANGQLGQLPSLAAELVHLDLDLIFSSSSVGLRAVQQATSTTPIVSPVIGDPVGDGYAVTLARPGKKHNRVDKSRPEHDAQTPGTPQGDGPRHFSRSRLPAAEHRY
jgi:putative ABC transport system substrate-binding protein